MVVTLAMENFGCKSPFHINEPTLTVCKTPRIASKDRLRTAVNKSPESILIACIRLIGDVILTTPLIGLLKEAYPEAAIDILVGKGTGEFLEKDPRVRRVLYSEKGGRGYFRDIFLRYDLAINMNASDRGNWAVLIAGRRQRVGFYLGKAFWKDVWKKSFFTHPLEFKTDIPVARYCESVAHALGIPVPHLTVKVFWDAADESRVVDLLHSRNCNDPFFVVHPFARWVYKYWRFDRFAAVSDAIADRYGLQPVWTSSPVSEEKALLANTARLCRNMPVLLGGELTLNQMTCLLSRCGILSGPRHGGDPSGSEHRSADGCLVWPYLYFALVPLAKWQRSRAELPRNERRFASRKYCGRAKGFEMRAVR